MPDPPTADAVREVRLRPQYAHLYKGIDAGVWLPATMLAKQLAAEERRRGITTTRRRTLDPGHFEFRSGGPRRPRGQYFVRTRAEDR